MKNLKLLSISLSLVAVLSACNLSGISSSPTQTTDQNPVGSVSQVDPTQTQLAILASTNTAPTVVVSPISTPFPPNTPVWSVYKYTCEFVDGGGTMTMNLTWIDRSNSEEGYTVYRDEQVIATLVPNSTHFVDVAFVATGKTLSYSVEAFTQAWRVSSSTITYGCQ